MQNDLISRKKLITAIKRQPSKMIDGKQYIRLDAVLEKVRMSPTVDAVPVVHARWLPRGSDDNDAGMYYCSACKDERYFGDEVITSEEASKYCPFCPNCGAKMDGGAEG